MRGIGGARVDLTWAADPTADALARVARVVYRDHTRVESLAREVVAQVSGMLAMTSSHLKSLHESEFNWLVACVLQQHPSVSAIEVGYECLQPAGRADPTVAEGSIDFVFTLAESKDERVEVAWRSLWVNPSRRLMEEEEEPWSQQTAVSVLRRGQTTIGELLAKASWLASTSEDPAGRTRLRGCTIRVGSVFASDCGWTRISAPASASSASGVVRASWSESVRGGSLDSSSSYSSSSYSSSSSAPLWGHYRRSHWPRNRLHRAQLTAVHRARSDRQNKRLARMERRGKRRRMT